jgi:hypothetical protein
MTRAVVEQVSWDAKKPSYEAGYSKSFGCRRMIRKYEELSPLGQLESTSLLDQFGPRFYLRFLNLIKMYSILGDAKKSMSTQLATVSMNLFLASFEHDSYNKKIVPS